jgi:hypothetical protein
MPAFLCCGVQYQNYLSVLAHFMSAHGRVVADEVIQTVYPTEWALGYRCLDKSKFVDFLATYDGGKELNDVLIAYYDANRFPYF